MTPRSARRSLQAILRPLPACPGAQLCSARRFRIRMETACSISGKQPAGLPIPMAKPCRIFTAWVPIRTLGTSLLKLITCRRLGTTPRPRVLCRRTLIYPRWPLCKKLPRRSAHRILPSRYISMSATITNLLQLRRLSVRGPITLFGEPCFRWRLHQRSIVWRYPNADMPLPRLSGNAQLENRLWADQEHILQPQPERHLPLCTLRPRLGPAEVADER